MSEFCLKYLYSYSIHKAPGVWRMGIACCIFFTCLQLLPAQTIKRNTLFTADSVLYITLVADFDQLYKTKNDSSFHSAKITFHLQPNNLEENIRIKARGVQRKLICNTPSLLLDFRNAGKSSLKKLGRLKLVTACDTKSYEEQLLLKEYLLYKMYNLVTEKSLRVRLLQIKYINQIDKTDSYKQYAFLVEDTDDMAKRNNCIELNRAVATEETNREQMTLLAIFQYMIGNIDWAVPALKNIKLIVSKEHTDENPVAVPYDFDYAGIVNAGYAIPHEDYNIESVRERVYKGFPRTPEEVNAALDTLRQHKQQFYDLIKGLDLLSGSNKKEMLHYLDEFYILISNKKKVKEIFIDNARRE